MKVRKALFQHDEPWRFTQGRWVTDNTVSWAYLIFKWLIAMFLLANQVLSLWLNFDPDRDWKGENEKSKYMIFLTHWGYVVITLAVTFDACLVTYRISKERSQVYMKRKHARPEECNWVLQLSILLTAMAYPMALFVTLMFWLFLYDFSQPFELNKWSYINLIVHLMQTIVALVDTFISSRPWRMWHMWCPMLLGLIYMIFNLLYIVAFDGTFDGHDYVYPVLDWNNKLGQTMLLVCLSFVGFPVLFSFFYFWAKLRDFLWGKYYRKEKESESVATSINRNGVYVISMKLQDTSSVPTPAE